MENEKTTLHIGEMIRALNDTKLASKIIKHINDDITWCKPDIPLYDWLYYKEEFDICACEYPLIIYPGLFYRIDNEEQEDPEEYMKRIGYGDRVTRRIAE